MFNNVKAKKRLAQVLIAFVVICMSVTGSFLLLEDSIRTVSAETYTWNVGSASEWNTQFGKMVANSNNTYDITLTGNVSNTSQTGGKLTGVPAGVTVNLNMNGYNITWDPTVVSNGNFNSSLAGTSYTSGTYANGEYWGLVTNKGTLNITGTGVIRIKNTQITTQKQDHDVVAQRLATIVNDGTLTVGGNVTVEAYLTYVHNSDTSYDASAVETKGSYSDAFMYNCGIYNTGTVTSSAKKISVGTMSGTSQTGSDSGYAYAFGYGIYGGNVNVTGGEILVDTFAGGLKETGSSSNAHIYAASVGVYSNNAFLSGNTSINVLSKNWEYQSQDSNTLSGGTEQLFSVGVLYTGASSPVIGPSVDVVASFEHIGNSKTQVYVPGDSNFYWSDVFSDSSAGTISHVAVPVGGVSQNVNNLDYHTSEKPYDSDSSFFGNKKAADSITKTAYRTTQAYYSGSNTTVDTTKMSNGSNDHVRYTSSIVNGVPGNTVNNGGVTSTNKGNPGDHSPKASDLKSTGSQYLFVYRYYRNVNDIDSVSFRWNNPSRLKNEAVINVGGANNTNGVIANNSTNIKYVSGGESVNNRYYEYVGSFYETTTSADANLTSRLADINRETGVAKTPSKWAGSKGNFPNDGTTVSSDNDKTIVIYLDYLLRDPSQVRVAASSKDELMNKDVTSTSFEVGYTGSALVPGLDFNLAIIDMGDDVSLDTNATDDDEDVTGVYDITGKGSSGIPVRYDYRVKGSSTWTENALPKDAGEYDILVKVTGDTTFKTEGSYNRNSAEIQLSCKIKPANVVITGPNASNSISGTYGATYNDLFNSFNGFTLTNNGKALPSSVSGNWSISGAEATKVPDAGTYTNLKVVWTPDDANKKNYSTAELPVSLIVNQRVVNVVVGAGTATYGEEQFTSNTFITFENLPAADNNKTAEWIANTTFTAKNNSTGVTKDFDAGLPVGSYTLSIESTKFGGATNQNYSFSFTDGTLTVQKKDLYYTAEAAGKTYDGSKDVSVKLTYSSGIFGGDPYEPVYMNVPGTMASANAGDNKVTVDTSNLDVNSNYNLVISNASTLKATVAKADPTGVAVVANPAVVTYDKTKTLSTIALDPTATGLAGTWAWETANTVPHVNQNKYVAVFTPADTTNYNTLKQDVTLNVEKKDVEVTVDAITVTYGDNVPVLTVKYNGFTGGDTLATIDFEGNAGATTTYTPGSGVDKKYPISVASTLESENYNFVKKDSEITVTPKALTVTAANDSIVYGTAAPEYNVSDVTATGFYGSDSLSSLNATVKVTTTYIAGTVTGKVGTYPINVEVTTANKNYNITTVAGTLTVTKAVLTVTPNAKTITFGADVPEYNIAGTDYAVTGFVNGDTLARVTITGAPVFTTAYTSESFVNSYPVTAVVTNMSSDNYTFVGASGTIKVVKADPNVSTAPTATVVNSHSLADAAFSNTAVVVNPNDSAVSVPGAFAFTNSSAVPAWGSSNSYEAVFTPDDTINYNTVKVNVKVTVTVKTISGTPVIQGSAMAGSTLTVSLAAMDPSVADGYTYQWYADDAIISGATGTTYKISESNIGKRIHVVIDAIEGKGFTGVATSAKTDAVIKALLETTAAQLKVVFGGVEYTDLGVDTTFADVEYDAMSHAGTVYIADGYNTNYFGTPVLKYNGSTEAPVTAGTYVVTVDVSTPKEPAGGYPENTYYGPATGIAVGTITITRAPYTVTVLANDKVYDGTVTATATITGSGLKNETDVVYLADTARYSFANANAGANKPITVTNVTLLGKDAGNYEIVVEPTTAAILPRVIYYRASGVDKFYDGTNTVAVEFTYDAGKNGTNSDWGYATVDNASTVYLTNGTAVATDVNAGDGIIITNIKATPSGTSSNNYEIRLSNEATATVNIKKAPVTLTTPVINGIVYDSTKPLSTIDLSHLNTAEGYWAFNDTTIVPSVKQKSYAATYYSKNANYEDATVGTITVNVTPKEVILTADNKTVTYSANAPTYTISASGFTGSDTLAMIGGNINATSTYAPGSDIGSYTIRITEALTRDNYTFVTREGYLTVAHATINVTASAVDKVYDGNANVTVNFSKLSAAAGVYVNDLGKVGLSFEKTTGQAKTANAGSTTVSYTAPTLIGDKAKNYQLNVTPKTGVLTVVIAKADLADVVFPENGEVEYGFDLTYATFGTEGVGDGTFEYENAKLTVPGNTGIHNNYKVIFTPTDPNYNTQEKVVTLNVIKCTLHYQVGISGKLQEGQTLTVVTTDLPAKATDFISYQWYRYDGNDYYAIDGANGKNYVVTDKDVGYTLVVMTSFDNSAPYVFANGVTDIIKDAADFVGELEGIIGESDDTIKEMNLTFWQRLMDWLYRIIAVLTGVRLGGGLGL